MYWLDRERGNVPCLFYAAFNNKIVVYYNIRLSQIGSTNLLSAVQQMVSWSPVRQGTRFFNAQLDSLLAETDSFNSCSLDGTWGRASPKPGVGDKLRSLRYLFPGSKPLFDIVFMPLMHTVVVVIVIQYESLYRVRFNLWPLSSRSAIWMCLTSR